jgi:hypothetical protein
VIIAFAIPSTVGKLYDEEGQKAPIRGWAGVLFVSLVLSPVWFVWIQKSLNRYWAAAESARGAAATPPADSSDLRPVPAASG